MAALRCRSGCGASARVTSHLHRNYWPEEAGQVNRGGGCWNATASDGQVAVHRRGLLQVAGIANVFLQSSALMIALSQVALSGISGDRDD